MRPCGNLRTCTYRTQNFNMVRVRPKIEDSPRSKECAKRPRHLQIQKRYVRRKSTKNSTCSSPSESEVRKNEVSTVPSIPSPILLTSIGEGEKITRASHHNEGKLCQDYEKEEVLDGEGEEGVDAISKALEDLEGRNDCSISEDDSLFKVQNKEGDPLNEEQNRSGRQSIKGGLSSNDKDDSEEEIGEDVIRVSRTRYVHKITKSSAEVRIKYRVTTSVICPCEDKKCQLRVRVGRYGGAGNGSVTCVHCGKGREDGGFTCASDLKRHVHSAMCSRKRGVSVGRANSKKLLGLKVAYAVENPMLRSTKDLKGIQKEVFNCPHCNGLPEYTKRYSHALACYPKHGVNIGPNEDPKRKDNVLLESDHEVEETEH